MEIGIPLHRDLLFSPTKHIKNIFLQVLWKNVFISNKWKIIFPADLSKVNII